MPRWKNKYKDYKSELDRRWHSKFLELKNFKKNYGHTNVIQQWSMNKSLGAWVFWQRHRKRLGKLSREREKLLDTIGFRWWQDKANKKTSWEARFKELLEFKKTYGHADVPLEWKQNPKLGTWISSQRSLKHHNKLRKERIEKLEAIGFKWRITEKVFVPWETRFKELVAFKEKYGHTNVSGRFKEYRHLNLWVKGQRDKRNRITPERKKKLDQIGFTWNLKGTQEEKELMLQRVNESWDRYFKELILFKKRFGHCSVPQHWKENKSLGNWVVKQRLAREKMYPERREKLDSVGFDWRPKRAPGSASRLKELIGEE